MYEGDCNLGGHDIIGEEGPDVTQGTEMEMCIFYREQTRRGHRALRRSQE